MVMHRGASNQSLLGPRRRAYTMNLLIGLRGPICHNFLDQASNGNTFQDFFREALAAKMPDGSDGIRAGDIVVMDNARCVVGQWHNTRMSDSTSPVPSPAVSLRRFHHGGAGHAVEALLATRGAAIVYLPSDSPHLPPAEMVFGQLKLLMRQDHALTRDAPKESAEACLMRVSLLHILSYYKHCFFFKFDASLAADLPQAALEAARMLKDVANAKDDEPASEPDDALEEQEYGIEYKLHEEEVEPSDYESVQDE